MLGGGNKAMVHAEGRIQSSLVVLEGGGLPGLWINQTAAAFPQSSYVSGRSGF